MTPEERLNEENAVVEDVFDSSHEAMVAFDEHGLITAWNKRAAEMFGHERDDVIGGDVFSLLFPESDRPERYKRLNYFLATGDEAYLSQRERVSLLDADAVELEAELTLAPRRAADSSPYAFHAFFHDVAVGDRARAAEQRLEAVMEASGDPIVTTNRLGLVTSWNPAAARLYGVAAEQIIGQPLVELFADEHRFEIEELLTLINSGGQVERMETERPAGDGENVPVIVSAAPLRDANGEVTGMSLIEHDISEIKHFESQVRFLAEHDPLTGLHNRRRFQVELENRLAAGATGAVLIVDVDHFKLINDAHGHKAGDQILRAMSQAVQASAELDEEMAHFGRDEFALLVNANGDAVARGAALLATVESKVAAQIGHHLSASVGIVRFRGDEESADGLLICADLALQTAKERGGGRCVVYDPKQMSGIRQVERLQKALAEERLVLYSQPILSLASGKVEGCELLLRMRDGDEVVSPASFLSAAERLGLIEAIDQWVIKSGIRYAATTDLQVEINLSGHSMTSRSILACIEAELSSSGADPRQIVFEITETAAVASMEEAMEFAERLRDLGCQFALDDFGTGFGSFIYLKQLPVELLKIDGEFIRNLTKSDVDRAVVRAIVSVARDLNKKTVAEWVDNPATIDLLRELGVDYAQGYFVGKPAPLGSAVKDSNADVT